MNPLPHGHSRRPLSRRNPSLFVGFVAWAALAIISTGVVGCSGDAGGVGSSLFEQKRVPVQAILQTKGGTGRKLAALAIHGCPAGVAHKAFTAAEKQHGQALQMLLKRIEAIDTQISTETDRLDKTGAAVAAEYNARVPSLTDSLETASRNPLEALSRSRGKKTDADDWLKQAHADRIAPINASISKMTSEKEGLVTQLQATKSSLSNQLFSALPAKPARSWKTDGEGRATLSVPASENWVVWADTIVDSTHFQWFLRIPDDLDSSGTLTLDTENTFGGTSTMSSLFTKPN
jgi:hypothetical protein